MASALSRLHQAMNAHDIDAFVDCFAEDYRSEQPLYPNRHFSGTAQVRTNWSHVFDAVPEELYLGSTICVGGTISLHEGSAEMVIEEPEWIWAP